MKKYIWILPALLLCSGFSQAQEVKWHTWNEAQVLAETQDKPMMIFVYASWCHLCKRMDTRVFTNDSISILLNEHFIPVKLDAEYKEELKMNGKSYSSMELLAELTDNQFRGIPAYLIISKTPGQKTRLEAGLKDPQEMIALLKESTRSTRSD